MEDRASARYPELAFKLAGENSMLLPATLVSA